jgi:LPXTG-site transpeptidase (sortase) family protein
MMWWIDRARQAIGRDDGMRYSSGVAVVMLTVLFILVGTAQPGAVRASRRVVSHPVRVLAQQPAVVRQVRTYAASPACPQLDNPGGLKWNPAPDAGPWSTDGVVRLPRFGVAAPIFRVGINTQSEMELPHNARDVAWLDEGGFPGDTQNPVLAGHINYSHRAGSFSRIQQLRPGDTIVVDINGKHYEYAVRWTCLFDRQTDLAAQIMGYTNTQSITLISCGGVFDPAAGTHNKRVAVRGELVKTT